MSPDPQKATAAVAPGATLGFVGLGQMGLPMARRLVDAGFQVRGYDPDPHAARRSGVAVDRVEDVAEGADAVILMLPDSTVVESVVHTSGLLGALRPGALLVDMGSSEPQRTRDLARRVEDQGFHLVDAPVSGGVKGAVNGTLTIMAGGEPGPVEAVRPLLDALGGRVLHVGPSGAGHALKAINNLLSATHLYVTSEAMLAGQEFGLDPAVMVEAINGSSGRSGSTENKWPNFMLGRGFDSGFALRLMVKDMRIATRLAASVGRPSALGEEAVRMWEEAARALPDSADHTEILRWLETRDDAAATNEGDT